MNNFKQILFFFFNVCLFLREWERDSERAQFGEGQREGDTESQAGSRLWAVSTEPDTGLEPTNGEIMTWAEVGHLTDWAIQMPLLQANSYKLLVSFHFCPQCLKKALNLLITSWRKWYIRERYSIQCDVIGQKWGVVVWNINTSLLC